MWQTLGRFAFSSGVNLRTRGGGGEGNINHFTMGKEEFIMECMGGGDEGGRGTAPFWVKFLWVRPVLRVVVEEVNGKVNNCSFGDSDSIDFNGFLSRAGGPKREW